MADAGTPFASTNALVEVYGRYITWVEKLARGERPQSEDEWVESLLAMFSADEELLDRAVDLTAAVEAHSMSSLPVEVQPEAQFVVEYVSGIPDVAQLRVALVRRSEQLRAIKAQGEQMPESYSSKLPDPFHAQWVGIRDAAKLLFNQVQLYNAQGQAAAFERAATLNGMPVEKSTHRGDDGSMTHTVSVTFDRGRESKPRWWQRFSRRRSS